MRVRSPQALSSASCSCVTMVTLESSLEGKVTPELGLWRKGQSVSHLGTAPVSVSDVPSLP